MLPAAQRRRWRQQRVVLIRHRWDSPARSRRLRRLWRRRRLRVLLGRQRTSLGPPRAAMVLAMSSKIFHSSAPTFSRLSTSNSRIFTLRTCNSFSLAWRPWPDTTSTSRRRASVLAFATTELLLRIWLLSLIRRWLPMVASHAPTTTRAPSSRSRPDRVNSSWIFLPMRTSTEQMWCRAVSNNSLKFILWVFDWERFLRTKFDKTISPAFQQMPAANPNAGQFAKQSAYNSGYGSAGYDALNQTAPDYSKTAYQSAGQQTKGHSASNQTGTNSDIASSMYNKSHVTLNKVNVSWLRCSFTLAHDIHVFNRLSVVRETIFPFGHATAVQLGWITSWFADASLSTAFVPSAHGAAS